MFQRPLFAPSMIVAIIALIVALGGVGYTAVKIPRNSVGRDQLRKSAVTESKLAKGAVTSSKIKDSSIKGADIDPAALPKVPTSATADRAKVADEVAGQRVSNVAATVPLGGFARVVGGDGGLEVWATCSLSGSLLVSVKSASEHAQLRASVVSASTPPATASVVDDADLNPGEELTIFGADGRGTAQIVYLAADGHVSTAVLGFSELTGTQTCTVSGTLTRT
jgi:hypothetical protein